MTLSRRNLLKGVTVGTVGLGMLSLTESSTQAQIAPTMADTTAYFRFALGDFEGIIISDGTSALPANFLGANQPEEDVIAFFEDLKLAREDGTLPNTFLNLVLTMGDTTVVFDTGNGAGAGKLVATLEALGIGVEGIDGVVMSHWHPDHINGLSNAGALTFPNATVYFPQAEYDFMQNGPQDVVGGAVAKLQPAIDADRVSFYDSGSEVMSGIMSVATPGHTPGHTSFMIESNGSMLYHFVDFVINPYASMTHTDWHFGFDADPDLAVQSRQMILDMASAEAAYVMGYHFPFPGLGYAINNGDGSYRWVPAAY